MHMKELENYEKLIVGTYVISKVARQYFFITYLKERCLVGLCDCFYFLF